jgi:hypothetical protein
MADIAVIFERHGAGQKSRIIVQNACQPVLDDEDINWHFYVEDNLKIDAVEIVFAEPRPSYFTTEEVDPVTGKTKKIHTYRQKRDLATGATIYGRPPARRLPKARGRGKGKLVKVPGYVDKYWVKGYRDGKLVAKLDPEIVPIRPPSP